MSYMKDLLTALLGRTRPAAVPGDAAASARAATLEMDLRERDQRIAVMRKEYATLETSSKRAAAGAGQEQLEQLFRKLAAPLASLSTLAALCDAGREVAAADLVSLLRSLEKQLKAAGLEQVGTPGESLCFDVAVHQRMSGGAVSAGTPVVVRSPGYRCGGKVLFKAMVTSKETPHE
jgi:molecular chaperone GrpE (heat shock protein)